MADIWWYEARQCWCTEVTLKDGRRKKFYLGKDKNRAKEKFHQKMAEYHGQLNSAEDDGDATATRDAGAMTFVELVVLHLRWMKANRAHDT